MRSAAIFACLWIACVAVLPSRAEPSREARARRLYDGALRRLERGGFEHRRLAVRDLEQASLLDSASVTYPLLLARLLLAADFLHESRTWAERTLKRDPGNAAAEAVIGLTWRRDWLVHVDEGSLMRAVHHLSSSAHRAPETCETWIALVPLLVEQDKGKAARSAAQRALEADSGSAEATLAAAYTAQRLGDLGGARSLFERALPGLRPEVRRSFQDIGPLLGPAARAELARMPVRRRVRFEASFWQDLDPDLVSPVNEAQLEYWSRAAHAYFLYFDRRRGSWDERGELYVRFGAPRWTERNPVSHPSGIAAPFNGNYMVWGYPHLGMRVWMSAANPMGPYYRPLRPGVIVPELLPYPDSLARRPDLVVARGGRGVFPRLPQGVTPLDLRGAVARFEGASGPRLLGHAECPGSPAESSTVAWVVMDSTGRERASGSGSMASSACDPAEARAGGFAADLPAGLYRVGMTMRDARGGLGVFRAQAEIPPATTRLSLSDVVITCGDPETNISPGQGVRIEPVPEGRLSNADRVTAYFEIYHLTPDARGESRFEYIYAVRSSEKDSRIWLQRLLAPRRLPPPLEASRSETTPESIRRQFVTVPIGGIPPGRYQIEIRVRDLTSGDEAVRAAGFIKEGASGLAGSGSQELPGDR